MSKHRGDTAYWKKEADRLFSLYIRQRFTDKNGMVKCSTCDNVSHWRNMDCGHFMSRKHNATRCNDKNAMQQCKSCNSGDKQGKNADGRQYEMGIEINRVFGEGMAEKMINLSRTIQKMNWVDWMVTAEYHRKQLKDNNFMTR